MSSLSNTIRYLAGTETFVNEDMNMKLDLDNMLTEYANLPEVPNKLVFPVSEVPIASFEESDDFRYKYGLNVNVLSLFMEMNEMKDLHNAINMITEHNHIDRQDLCIVFNSDDDIKAMLEDAKHDKEPSSAKIKVHNLNRTGALVQALKKDGLGVAKEPGVTDIKWNEKTHIVNIDQTTPFMSDGVDWDSLKNY